MHNLAKPIFLRGILPLKMEMWGKKAVYPYAEVKQMFILCGSEQACTDLGVRAQPNIYG